MANKNYKQREIKKSMGIRGRRIVAHTVLILVTILCLFWFFMLFINCTRTHSEISRGFSWLPGKSFLENWKNMIGGTLDWRRGLINSFLVAALSTIVGVYCSTMTAYAIYAYDFKGRNFFAAFILAIMMIPNQVSSLGFVKLCTALKLKNNFLPFILPSMAAPITYFYLKQYMESNLSMSLIEAARIDGSSEIRTFNRVAIPLMKPAISVQAIFSFVGSWNNYFQPAILLREPEVKTLPILIANLRSADWLKFDMGQVYMSIAFSIFPVIFVYMILAKNIVAGVSAGGVKG